MYIVLLIASAVLAINFIRSKYKTYLSGRKLAGPFALPLLGNVQMISKLKPEYLFISVTENRKKYRQSFRLWLGPQLWVYLHSPEETRAALNDSSLVRADTFQQLNVLIGNGLLISEGKHWETHRRALGPAFHPTILNSFTPTIANHADSLCGKIVQNIGETIEVGEYVFPCILDAIIETSMGINLKTQNDPNGTYTKAFHKTSELLFKRMVNPLLASNFVFKRTKMYRELMESIKTIHNLMDSIIKERSSILNKTLEEQSILEKKQKTLLTILLTTEIDGRSLTFQEIRDEVNTFVFAGVDTTTAAMSFILYSLAKYPNEQYRVFEEIKGASHSKDLELTVSQVDSLKYLDMFVKECLRYYTIVPMTGRQTTRDTKIGNNTYCSGVTLWINMYGLAHDEQLFENPYEFKPLRFSENNIKPFSYLPFSGGPHICIGRKYAMLIMKVLIVKLLQNFEICLSNPNEKLILMAQMVLKSSNGINVKFKLR